MQNQAVKSKGETPLLLRFLLVLAVIGILFTLLPTGNGVALADYDAAPNVGATATELDL